MFLAHRDASGNSLYGTILSLWSALKNLQSLWVVGSLLGYLAWFGGALPVVALLGDLHCCWPTGHSSETFWVVPSPPRGRRSATCSTCAFWAVLRGFIAWFRVSQPLMAMWCHLRCCLSTGTYSSMPWSAPFRPRGRRSRTLCSCECCAHFLVLHDLVVPSLSEPCRVTYNVSVPQGRQLYWPGQHPSLLVVNAAEPPV